MDLLTDLQILQDLLDASSRRGVAVYAVLDARGVPHFLDMCSRLQVNATHLRVRRGRGLMIDTKVKGQTCDPELILTQSSSDSIVFGVFSVSFGSFTVVF